ncbi:hypothetical protein [Ornithinibacillus contaminans]|uniref:hypothetical protein n=1 Tax=Ornithinibacillus contaminans TaxID=694055 RepID=UPI00138EF13B|nr:hypothetical protein [Ornithinibacillus contaminans]
MDNKNNLFIPAGLFIGLGIGKALGNVGAGLFIGLGMGFLISTLVYMGMSKKKER